MKQTVQRRGVKNLWHFTRLDNVQSIIENGIVPRATLEAAGSNVNFNDDYRYDGFKQASCISVSYPNYKMFYILRQQNPGVEWVVIAVLPDVLWLKNCAFCSENAASNSMTKIPIQQRMGVEAFERMFDPVENIPTRNQLGLEDRFTTNPQAEVLVFDTIEIQLIRGFVVSSENVKKQLQAIYPNIEFVHSNVHYSPRSDYMYW